MPTIAPITLSNLTEAEVTGNGVFDVLMKASKAHLEEEFNKNRIRGPEYSQVYLGSLTAILSASIQFLLQKDKTSLEADLLNKQIELATVEVQKAQAELAILQANLNKIPAEIALLEQQKLNLQDELLTSAIQRNKITQEIDNLVAQEAQSVAQKLQIEGQTLLIAQQKLNAITEGTVLVAQECKLRAEYDVLMLTKDKTTSETALLNQKSATERAQTTSTGVDDNSVIGRQKTLYVAQASGFKRDAEQKAAKIMIDSWSVRRSTDEATAASATNKLDDTFIGQAVQSMLTGLTAV